jgi:murein DD-endopeptidase MepM/ murein hydrolase activator NlpD
MRKNNYLALLLLFLAFQVRPSFGQEITINQVDTTQADDIEEDLDAEDDSSVMDAAIIPFDSTNVPAANIYPCWNNNIVNPYNIRLSSMPDTVVIPLKGYVHPNYNRLTSDFGWRRWRYHYGVDMRLMVGDSMKSAFDGMIRIAKRSRTFGNYIIVRHNNGLETIYGHLSKIMVSVNQRVKAGDVIGLGGNTGRSTGPHLHFEVRYLGSNINPHDIIDFENGRIKCDSVALCQKHFAYLSEIHKARYHVVRRGDTLGKIAHRYGVSVNRLCKLNKIKRGKAIRKGQKIRYI